MGNKKYLLIMVIIITLLFSSCSDKSANIIYRSTSENYGDTGGLILPVDINNTKISIMLSSGVSDLSDKVVIKELSERTGIDINIINVPLSEMEQQTKVMMSTNELPDILFNAMSFDEINNLGIKGTFVPINKYLNELSNFKRVFLDNKEYSRVFDLYSAKDGNLYVFPGYEEKNIPDSTMLYRKDIFEKNGIRMWNDRDGFYNALKKLKEIYPESIPYSTRRKTQIFDDWSLSFDIDFPGLCYDEKEGKWILSCVDLRCKEMLDYIRKLYHEGLIDSNFFISSEITWENLMTAEEKSFVTLDTISSIDYLTEKSVKKNPKYDLRYANPIGKNGKFRALEAIKSGPCVTNNQNKLISLKLLDYLLSPSGIELMNLGVKNKTFIYDNEKISYLGFMREKDISIEDLKDKYGLFVDGLCLSHDRRSAYFNHSKNEQEAVDRILADGRLKDTYHLPEFTLEERTEIKRIIEDISNKAYNFATQYVVATKIPEDMFEKWIEEANKLGAQTLLNMYNK